MMREMVMVHVVDVKSCQYDSIERSRKKNLEYVTSVRSKKSLIKHHSYVTKQMIQTGIKTIDEYIFL